MSNKALGKTFLVIKNESWVLKRCNRSGELVPGVKTKMHKMARESEADVEDDWFLWLIFIFMATNNTQIAKIKVF